MSQYITQKFRFALDNAETFGRKIVASGNIVHVVKASSAAATIDINVTGTNLQGSGYLTFQERDKLEVPDPFDRMTLQWSAQAGEWVDIMVVTIDPAPTQFSFTQEQRGTIDSIADTVTVKSEGGTNWATTQFSVGTGTGSTLALAARTARKQLFITNHSTSTSLFVSGNSGVTTTTGHYVGALSTKSHDFAGYTGAVYLVSTTTLTASITEIW